MTHERRASLDQLYDLLAGLGSTVGGPRRLRDCDGRMDWPTRGVYFFFEDGEVREDGETPRVVRVGTHALRPSSSTLWGRLSQHRGSVGGSMPGGGNHRGSIFRLHVGTALMERGDWPTEVKASWGRGGNASREDRQLESELERAVSEHIGSMHVLWLPVDDPPSAASARGVIEAGTIALLSNVDRDPVDPPSSGWLGRYADRDAVRKSGLWNVNHVLDDPDPRVLAELERWIAKPGSRPPTFVERSNNRDSGVSGDNKGDARSSMDRRRFLDELRNLTMAPVGATGRRYPHKPLLLLWLLGRQQRGETGLVRYEDVQEPVDRLIAEFGTPAQRSKDRAAMPFFHLESTLWERHATREKVELTNSGGRLREAGAVGRLTPEVEGLLQREPDLIDEATRLLLELHFTDSHVDLVCGEVGISLDGERGTGARRRRRDPMFRANVLAAYGYVCAMCGWDGRLFQQSVGLAAAHLRWHSHDGPDEISNGLSLCELHHKLLDLGVLGITSECQIVVADAFVARSEVGYRLGHELEGRPLQRPLPRFEPPATEHIEWHSGQVFHGAA